MFKFLFRPKVKIDSVTVPTFGWEMQHDDATKKLWVNPEGSVALSLNFFDQKPDIPSLNDIDVLRSYYRNQGVKAKGGILEVNVIDLQGYPAVKAILKVEHNRGPQELSGTAYIATLTIPFRDFSFVIKVQAIEVGGKGMRETLVLDRLMETGVVTLGDDGLQGWMRDPYLSGFREGKLMNRSEEAVWDAEFPEHVLSEVRGQIGMVSEGIGFSEGLGKVAGFG